MGMKAVVAVTREAKGTDQNIRPGVKAAGRRDAVGLHGNRHPPTSYRQEQTVKGVPRAGEGMPAPSGPHGKGVGERVAWCNTAPARRHCGLFN